MHTEIGRISNLLYQTYEGAPWHGSSVKQVLLGINAQLALKQVLPNTHTIWEIVRHMAVWRNFAFQKIAGEKTFDVLNSEQDWPSVSACHESNWQEDLQALNNNQKNLLQAIRSMSDERLEWIVPGREYSFYTLLHGMIQHDLYHAGQIALLKKHIGIV